ncbi:MAG TPA: GntR family transcriptional regulator, partial [Amycolatopsis sp.]|nr:GntR family transcriptional regulator [Amycolatopsis sp.]
MTTTAQNIARRVRLALVTGELDRHRTYTERELLELSQSSRPVLREALRVLESEQLVTVRRGAHGGARFSSPGTLHVARYAALLLYHSGTTLGDIEDARVLLEAEIVRDIAARRADVRAAESVLVAEAAHLDQPDELPRHASAWHRALLGCAGNSVLDVVLNIVDLSLRPLAEVARARTAASMAGRRNLQQSHVVHAQVLLRLSQGDADAAADLWLRHTRAGERLFSAVAARERLDLLDLIDGVTPGEESPRSFKGADIIAASLRRRIVTGQLREGDRLPTEGALADEWGVAAPSIREAVRILAAEGLITPIRGSHLGPKVRPPDT